MHQEAAGRLKPITWITGDASDSTLLFLFIALTLGCDETPKQFGSITRCHLYLWLLWARTGRIQSAILPDFVLLGGNLPLQG